MTIHAEQTLAPDAAAPAIARASVRDTCAPVAPELVDDAQLLVSELVTNAIRHGREPVTVSVDCNGSEIVVAVEDSSSELPRIRRTTRRTEGGRGLLLVQRLAADWGVRPTRGGKQVWFRLT